MNTKEAFWWYHRQIEEAITPESNRTIAQEYQTYYQNASEEEKGELDKAYQTMFSALKEKMAATDKMIETYRNRFPELA